MDVTTKLLQQEGTPKQPSPPRKKRKQQGQGTGDNNAPKKKRIRTKCSSDGCTLHLLRKKEFAFGMVPKEEELQP